jgi:hypothetical protein
MADESFEYTFGLMNSTANVEDSQASLFTEIGQTLQNVGRQGLSVAGDTVKTILADRLIKSPEGQAQVAAYKMEYFFKYLPWMALAALGIFLFGKYARS